MWLINTGWTGGPYRIGKQCPKAYTKNDYCCDEWRLDHVDYQEHEIFGLHADFMSGCARSYLKSKMWNDPQAYDEMANELAMKFRTT